MFDLRKRRAAHEALKVAEREAAVDTQVRLVGDNLRHSLRNAKNLDEGKIAILLSYAFLRVDPKQARDCFISNTPVPAVIVSIVAGMIKSFPGGTIDYLTNDAAVDIMDRSQEMLNVMNLVTHPAR